LSRGDSDETRKAERSRRRIAIAWTLVVIWAAIVWFLGTDAFSLRNTSDVMGVWLDWLIGDMDYRTRYRIYLGARKAAHVVEYAILALLTFRAALITAHRHQIATACSAALFIVATLASADEARQALSDARTGSPWDVLIDLTGGVIAVTGVLVISRRMRGAPQTQPTA